MKLQLKTLSRVLLPLLLSVPAAAQVRTLLPGGSNPHIGSPIRLPGPSINPVAGMRIDLPAPRLNPGLSVNLAPTPSAPVAIMGVFPILPIPMIPSRPVVPVVRPSASRENVAHPLAPILPGLGAQFSEAASEKKNDWQKELGEELFDGRLIPSRKPAPVRPGEYVTLPEADLEVEIGAY